MAAWIRLTVYRSNGRRKFGSGKNLNILLNHGQSSGGYITAALGKLERQTVSGWRDVDMMLSSHNHMLGHVVTQQIGVTTRGKMRLVDYKQVLAKTGCFKKAYLHEPTSNSYEERSFFRPQARGWFECKAKITHSTARDGSITPDRWQYYDFNS